MTMFMQTSANHKTIYLYFDQLEATLSETASTSNSTIRQTNHSALENHPFSLTVLNAEKKSDVDFENTPLEYYLQSELDATLLVSSPENARNATVKAAIF
jgi:hypothetical protein